MSKTQLFIEKARAKHGTKFDYSKTVYVNAKTNVSITCPVHGTFSQRAHSHLNTQYGCRECSIAPRAKSNRVSNADFIKTCVEKHGQTYDYAQTKYTIRTAQIDVRCRIHGGFKIRAGVHADGGKCPKCTPTAPVSYDDFVKRAIDTHGELYLYTARGYKNLAARVSIICRIHGGFTQTATSHLAGRGCPKCATRRIALMQASNVDDFVLKARAVHGDTYIYNEVLYVTARIKVAVKCKKHGRFMQLPSNHLNGSGCPSCAPSPFDRDQPTAIYLMQMGAQVKIGISINPESRLSQLNRHNPKPARIVTTWALEDFPSAYMVEQKLHRELAGFNAGLTGFDGATEWFDTTPEYATTVIERILTPTTTNRDAPVC